MFDVDMFTREGSRTKEQIPHHEEAPSRVAGKGDGGCDGRPDRRDAERVGHAVCLARGALAASPKRDHNHSTRADEEWASPCASGPVHALRGLRAGGVGVQVRTRRACVASCAML